MGTKRITVLTSGTASGLILTTTTLSGTPWIDFLSDGWADASVTDGVFRAVDVGTRWHNYFSL